MTAETGSALANARREVAAAMEEEERLHARYREHLSLAGRWERRAVLAVTKGLDGLARQALERRRHYQALADAYRIEYGEHRRHVAALAQGLEVLERDVNRRRGAPMGGRPTPRGIAMLQLEADPVADRLAAWEREELLEHQLAELKARLAGDVEGKR